MSGKRINRHGDGCVRTLQGPLLCLKSHTRAEVEADLHQLIGASGIDQAEKQRRQELLQMFHDRDSARAIDFTKYTMEKLS